MRSDGLFWRKALLAGVEKGPDAFVRYSPALIGMTFGMALPWARHRVRQNLRNIHGPRPAADELRDVASVFATYGSCLAEALLLASGRGYPLDQRQQGLDHFDRLHAQGKGVILATAHTAGWEMAGPYLGTQRKLDVMVVMQPERDPRARAIQDEARQKAGVKVAHVGDSPFDALPLLYHLRGGGVVAMQMDRAAPGQRTREVELFGKPFEVPEGPLTLASVSGAPILAVFTRRLGFMAYEAIVRGEVRVPRRPRPEQLDEGARQLVTLLEGFVREHPTQWFHFR